MGVSASALLLWAGGCSPSSHRHDFRFRPMSIADHRAAKAFEESTQWTPPTEVTTSLASVPPPPLFATENLIYRDVSLEEVVRIALSNSTVLRDLGGRLVSQPNQAITTSQPELIRTDARTGVDAALAAFDLQWKAGLNYNRSENGLRNPIVGSPILVIQQQKGLGSFGMTKVGQAGTRYSVTQGHIFDADNVGVPPGRFPSAFDTFLAFDGRHPLGRGGGRVYNAIAGPNSPFGTYNGYWIASIRGDIADDELKTALRDYMFNVVRNYWLLKFAYDNVELRMQARDVAQELLLVAEERQSEGVGDETAVLQAREKLFAAQQAYDNAIVGPPERTLAGILGPNGALITGTELGMRSVERRLRLLIGIPNDQAGLLRPSDSPSSIPMEFDYGSTYCSAIQARPELQRQAKVIEQRRMEWMAARNLRLPSIDLIGQYRVHGFGQQLFGNSNIPQDSSISEFLKGDLQDIAAGVEITRPAGNRLAITAERNAMASIARETAILTQQQLEVSYEVSAAIAEVERSQKILKTSQARLENSEKTLASLKEKFENGFPVPIDSILESKRALTDLELANSIARVDYSIALASLAVARGTLLSEVSIFCGSADMSDAVVPIPIYHSIVGIKPSPQSTPLPMGTQSPTQNMASISLGVPIFEPTHASESTQTEEMARVSLAPPNQLFDESANVRLANPIPNPTVQLR